MQIVEPNKENKEKIILPEEPIAEPVQEESAAEPVAEPVQEVPVKKKKKGLKIFLISVGVLVVIVAALLVWGLARSNWSFSHLFNMIGNGHFSCMVSHEFEPANCQHGELCTVCGLEIGEKADHQWVDADCVQPRHCTVCELTEGKPLGHKVELGYCSACKKYVNTIPTVVDKILDEEENIANYSEKVSEYVALAASAYSSTYRTAYLNTAARYCGMIATSAGNIAKVASGHSSLSRVKGNMTIAADYMKKAANSSSYYASMKSYISSGYTYLENAMEEMVKLLGE